MRRGTFVVIEGADGSGKSTQVALLVDRLRATGLDTVATFEPGGTSLGARVRDLVLQSTGSMEPVAEALLLAADRAQHVREIVAPALARGAVVVSDRYLPSSLAYQGSARGLGVEEVEEANRWATDGLEPDLVVVLDVDRDTAADRGAPRPDRIERQGEGFQDAVRHAYRALAPSRGWTVIDGSGAADAVAARVWSLVDRRVGRDHEG